MARHRQYRPKRIMTKTEAMEVMKEIRALAAEVSGGTVELHTEGRAGAISTANDGETDLQSPVRVVKIGEEK